MPGQFWARWIQRTDDIKSENPVLSEISDNLGASRQLSTVDFSLSLTNSSPREVSLMEQQHSSLPRPLPLEALAS